ncbi:chemosensory pili system protein ChpC [Gammaproteobacteria bacterium]
MKINSVIRSLLLPLIGDPLLLPSVVLAEVISYRMPEFLSGAPSWLLGLVEWRGISVPVLSFEEFRNNSLNDAYPATTPLGTRIAILNGITDNPLLPFLGLRIQGIPRLVLVREGDLILCKDKTSRADANSTMYLTVELLDQPAFIPDLEAFELLISSYMKNESRISSSE